jgi:hypothetical protein
MWIEGDCQRASAKLAGAANDLGDDPLVTAMHTVEVPDRGDSWAEWGGDLVQRAKYLHAVCCQALHQAISNLSWRPS